MNVDEIFNTPRKKVDIENIQLPENVDNDTKENSEKTTGNGEQNTENGQLTMSCAQLASMAIGLYDAIQSAIYKRIEPAFNAKLTAEETNALLPPTTAVLELYNVTVSPITALIVTIVGINVGKIMQLKILQSQIAAAAAEQAKEAEKVKVVEQPTAGSVTTEQAPEKKETKKNNKK